MSSWFGSSAAPAAPTQAEQNLKNAQDAVANFGWSNIITPTPEYTAAKDAEKIAQDAVNAEKAAKAAAPVAQTGGKRRKSAGGKRKKNTGGKSRKVKKEKK
jgi:hypothetical protein